MNKTSICIAGISGWVGKALVDPIMEQEDLELISGIARGLAGQQIQKKSVDGQRVEIPVFGTLAEAINYKKPDVLIDYTKPNVVKENTFFALEHAINIVIGTSGLSDEDYEEIGKLALRKECGVIAAGNFSITANLLKVFACMAAKYLPYREIIEYSPAGKPDAPNGTSRELSLALSKVGPSKFDVPVSETQGEPNSRGVSLNNIQIHSVRLPSFASSNEVILAGPEERLHLRQETTNSAMPYVQGTLLAAKKVNKIKGLVRGLESILSL